jgi:uncharacterized membrane protein
METLAVLLFVFGFALFTTERRTGRYQIAVAARIAMSAMLLFAAQGHLLFAPGTAVLLPRWLPCKTGVAYLPGIAEAAAAAGMQLARFRKITAWLLLLFFVLILPASIKEGLEHMDIYKANYEGERLAYLCYRIPLQLLFMVWTYCCAIKQYMPVPQRADNTLQLAERLRP